MLLQEALGGSAEPLEADSLTFNQKRWRGSLYISLDFFPLGEKGYIRVVVIPIALSSNRCYPDIQSAAACFARLTLEDHFRLLTPDDQAVLRLADKKYSP